MATQQVLKHKFSDIKYSGERAWSPNLQIWTETGRATGVVSRVPKSGGDAMWVMALSGLSFEDWQS